jgi:hypothetical protein
MKPVPTKNGHDFFVVSSMLQKSLRRGDVILAAKAAHELWPKYANYVWNRLLCVSAEDCEGLMTQEVIALYEAWRKLTKDSKRGTAAERGHPIFMFKAIVLLAKCKHARDADELHHLVARKMPEGAFEWELSLCEALEDIPAEQFEIPEWVYDVHTRRGKRRGMTKQQFLRDEHHALSRSSTIFANFEEMAASETYVQPELDL